MNEGRSRSTETVSVPLEVKEIHENGTFTGYASTFGNIDLGRDVIHPGAFSKSLKKKLNKIKMLWQHDARIIIGAWESIVEDAKGLLVKGRLILEVEKAREAYALMRAGVLDSMSIGFEIPKGGCSIDDGKRVRNIHEADLWEISLVTFPMNPKASVTAVKSVVPFQDLPLADRGRAWDSGAAEERVRQWAGGGSSLEDMDWQKYRKAFLWYDSENQESIAFYKLQIADVIGGELTAVPRAVFAAAGAMLGARGGVDIPDNDRSRVISHLERYYSKMDMESPFKMIDMGEGVKSYVHALLSACGTEREFERTLRDVGFSTKEAKIFASTFTPQRDVEDNELAVKFREAADLLKSINR